MDPAVLYRPVHRTPPDYQTVIKLLLMASVLDVSSFWDEDPVPRTSYGLATDSEPSQQTLPPIARETLKQLGVPEEHWPTGSPRTPSLAVRALGLLLFNSWVLWMDLGGVLVPARGPPSEILSWNAACWRTAAYVGNATSGELLPSAENCRTAFSRPVLLPQNKTSAPSEKSLAPVTTGSAWMDATLWARGVLRAMLEAGEPMEGVPWGAEVVSLVLLVFVVCAVPRCPVVLESACNFLMC